MTTERHAPAAPVQSATMRALWSALDAAANPASMLALLIVLVRTLSVSDYGILVIALAASAISTAVNPAIAATTTKFVSGLAAHPDATHRRIASVITGSLLAVAVIDIVLVLGAGIFNPQLSDWLFGGTAAVVAARAHVLLLAMLAVGAQQVDAVYAAAFRGLERFGRQAGIELLMRTVLVIAVGATAWRTRSVQAVLIAQFGACALSALVRALAVRAVLPGNRLFALPHAADARELFGYGSWMWLTAMAGVAYTAVDRIIIGRIWGPAAAGQYNVYVQITQLIHFLPSSLFAFSFPAFSRAAVRPNGRGEIARAYKTYFLVIAATALGLAVLIGATWSPLLRVVTGVAFDPRLYDVVGLLTLNFVILAMTIAPYYLLIALGDSKSVSVIASISVLAAVVLMTVLIPRYGLLGAALARLIYGIGTLAFIERARHAVR